MRPTKGLSRGEGRQGPRAVPGQGAAEIAAAAAQAHRHEGVVARGQARSGEAQEEAALVDELRHAGMGAGIEGADIGEDQHGDLFVDQLRDGFRDRPWRLRGSRTSA